MSDTYLCKVTLFGIIAISKEGKPAPDLSSFAITMLACLGIYAAAFPQSQLSYDQVCDIVWPEEQRIRTKRKSQMPPQKRMENTFRVTKTRLNQALRFGQNDGPDPVTKEGEHVLLNTDIISIDTVEFSKLYHEAALPTNNEETRIQKLIAADRCSKGRLALRYTSDLILGNACHLLEQWQFDVRFHLAHYYASIGDKKSALQYAHLAKDVDPTSDEVSIFLASLEAMSLYPPRQSKSNGDVPIMGEDTEVDIVNEHVDVPSEFTTGGDELYRTSEVELEQQSNRIDRAPEGIYPRLFPRVLPEAEPDMQEEAPVPVSILPVEPVPAEPTPAPVPSPISFEPVPMEPRYPPTGAYEVRPVPEIAGSSSPQRRRPFDEGQKTPYSEQGHHINSLRNHSDREAKDHQARSSEINSAPVPVGTLPPDFYPRWIGYPNFHIDPQYEPQANWDGPRYAPRTQSPKPESITSFQVSSCPTPLHLAPPHGKVCSAIALPIAPTPFWNRIRSPGKASAIIHNIWVEYDVPDVWAYQISDGQSIYQHFRNIAIHVSLSTYNMIEVGCELIAPIFYSNYVPVPSPFIEYAMLGTRQLCGVSRIQSEWPEASSVVSMYIPYPSFRSRSSGDVSFLFYVALRSTYPYFEYALSSWMTFSLEYDSPW